MKTRLFLFAILLFMVYHSCNRNGTDDYIAPVNRNATPEAVNLYHFIQDVQGKYTISGQHNFSGKGSEYSDYLEEITGKEAIIWGSDFSFCIEGENALRFQHCGPANLPAYPWKQLKAWKDSLAALDSNALVPQRPDELQFLDLSLDESRRLTIEEIKKQHANGHIITMMWHGCFPTDGDCCNGSSIWAMENRPSPEQWDELVTEGTILNDAWKEAADKIAGYLKELQEENIPVLWRPYHEMNGVWFWWCNHKGEQGFKRLWIMMYDYFTDVHQLNNLIWVWNTNAPRDIPGDEAWPYEDFFPGSDYVDILAADVYRSDFKQSHHDDLLRLAGGKPIALGEVGNIPSPEILGRQNRWSWFMPWGWILFNSNDNEQIRELYNSDIVLTLDEVEIGKQGTYKVK